ncbi:tyrosine-type recombinase/integrase [Domibacillus tundrae]|uniref:tyrosine-type recombinase/integrase n=1 Tax=Domibacillus tundrae TaxID=1587527 RepID=UPI003CCBBA98
MVFIPYYQLSSQKSSIDKPINPRNLLRAFRKLTEEANLPRIHFHDLRHTHAALMIFQNEPMKVTR